MFSTRIKYFVFLGLIVQMLALPAFGQSIINKFTGITLQDKVVLIWETRTEQNLREFRVERSTDGEMFFLLGVVQAENRPSSYEFTDESVFAKPIDDLSGDRTYIYRLKIIFQDGKSEYTNPIQVSPRISGTRHTWGSIKAMFK